MSVLTNPFAPHPERVPAVTAGSLWGMRSAFDISGTPFEVETSHWSGTEIYRIRGDEVLRVRNLGWHAKQTFDVNGHQVEITGRWYPLLPVMVTVDGKVRIHDLFPQLRVPISIAVAVVLPVFLVLSASIAWDLWRLAGL